MNDGIILAAVLKISQVIRKKRTRAKETYRCQQDFFFFFLLIYYLFTYFWLCWVFVAAVHTLSLVAVSGASLVVGHRLWACGLSSCSLWAQVLCNMWNLPGFGIKLKFFALASGFISTESPGKSINRTSILKIQMRDDHG